MYTKANQSLKPLIQLLLYIFPFQLNNLQKHFAPCSKEGSFICKNGVQIGLLERQTSLITLLKKVTFEKKEDKLISALSFI